MARTIDTGIDLGTTNSAIARQSGVTTEVVEGPGGPLTPSAIYVGDDGRVLAGAEALAKRASEPERVATEFKRLMGTAELVSLGGERRFTPEALSAEVLKALIARAAAKVGEPITSAVITIPAMFQLPQCEATREAAGLAGLAHAPLLQEPIAAAIASLGTAELRDGYWLIYDLGGGTFDVSLVRSRDGRLQVLDHDGDNHLGGKDFDRMLARRMADLVRADGRLGDFSRADPRFADTYLRLRTEAERVRIALSDRDEEWFRIEPPSGAAFDLPVGREEVEALLRPTLARTVQLCRDVLARNRLEPSALSRLVLVGGPTQTPCLRRYLEADLGVEARHHVDPTLAVVIGAAIYAATQRAPPTPRRPLADGLAAEIAYEPMTNDPRPIVAGKLVGARRPGLWRVAVVRDGEAGASAFGDVGADGAFSLRVELAPNRLNALTLIAESDGQAAPLEQAKFVIIHGARIAKPVLSQSVGVMLSDNTVRWYLKKGAVLPTRRTMSLSTTVSLKRGQAGFALHVPLIQGESQHGDRNTVIGEVQIKAEDLSRDLASGSEVVITLGVDEHSITTAQAHIPALGQTFDEIVKFGLAARTPDEIRAGIADQQKRLAELDHLAAELGGEVDLNANLQAITDVLDEAAADDRLRADALLQKMTQTIDAMVSLDLEAKLVRDFTESECRSRGLLAAGDVERERELTAVSQEFNEAVARADLELAEAKLTAAREIEWSLVREQPGYWRSLFDYLSEKVLEGPNAAEARLPIDEGKAAVLRNDEGRLVRACVALIRLLPEEAAVPASILSHVA